MPIVVDLGFQLMDSQEPSPETISAMIMSVIEGACSRLAHLIDCVEHYMPTSTIFLDVFLLNMMDMNRLNANEPAIADGFCTPSKKLGFQSAINCMMQPNNSASIQMCLTPELQTEFEIFDNVSEINAVDGIDIRNRFCSPVKSFVNCILDIVETKCNDTTVQTMVATGRDMLLSILRSDCGGVTDPPFVVEDGARGLSVHAFLYLLMGLVAVLVSHRL
ncbi:uncharacterized protein LOC132557197 [Ylistrum balloti]|uniref:uncharacterized protein LOC132557197 n=1 Tax=Ylistrum balloti TaxID=509963 RepID=UPI002905F0F1|nr:uncharacterized protein LOC132557197 [Ylistrum balloti]